MPLALILSSHVAGSRVGGLAQALTLAPFGVDPVPVPTVLFGRHPGWGAPGGAAVADETFAAMLDGVEANGLFGLSDAVITGYFATPGQVEAAARAIDAVRAADHAQAFAPGPKVIVDPIMGDEGAGLYVRPGVAEAITELLVPRADWLTPNAWELARLSGLPVETAAEAIAAARAVGKPMLVTSAVDQPGEIAMVCATADEAALYGHRRLEQVPRGTGDLVTAVFAAGLIDALSLGDDAFTAAERAARAAAETVEAARQWSSPELPLVSLGQRLVHPTAALRVERRP